MEDVTRKRILRKLESLPEAQLYQVLDYIEFVEAKYAALKARKPDAFQQFAERVEDQMRVRSLAPKAVMGTMKLMSTAGRVLDGVRGLGRDLVTPVATRPEGTSGTVPLSGSGDGPGGDDPGGNHPAGSHPAGSRPPGDDPAPGPPDPDPPAAQKPDRMPPGGANGSG